MRNGSTTVSIGRAIGVGLGTIGLALALFVAFLIGRAVEQERCYIATTYSCYPNEARINSPSEAIDFVKRYWDPAHSHREQFVAETPEFQDPASHMDPVRGWQVSSKTENGRTVWDVGFTLGWTGKYLAFTDCGHVIDDKTIR